MLVLSRSLQRQSWRASDAVAGAARRCSPRCSPSSILGATSVAASKPWQDWRTWQISGFGTAHLRFNWMQNYARLLDPATKAPVMHARPALCRLVLAGERARCLQRHHLARRRPVRHASSAGPSPTRRRLDAVPAAQLEPAGAAVTEPFSVASTYTDYLFVGGFAEIAGHRGTGCGCR